MTFIIFLCIFWLTDKWITDECDLCVKTYKQFLTHGRDIKWFVMENNDSFVLHVCDGEKNLTGLGLGKIGTIT